MYDFPYPNIVFEYERSQDLDDAIPYDLTSMPGSCLVLENLVDELFISADLAQLISATGKKTRHNAENRLKNALRSLLWHLHCAVIIHPDSYVHISMRTSSFVHCKIRNPHKISRDIAPIIKQLAKKQMIEFHKGYNDRGNKCGKNTRIRATYELMEQLRWIPTNLTETYVERPPILFRDPRDALKAPLPVSPFHPDIRETETVLKEYNATISKVSVSIDGHNGNLIRFTDKLTVNLCRKSLTAIYHVEDDGRITYGRIHGGFWQIIPRNHRCALRINGEPTVEYDYSAQGLNIVAALEGATIQGDGYAIDIGIPHCCPVLQREFIKFVIMVFMNADSEKKAFQAIRQKFRKEPNIKTNGISLTDNALRRVSKRILKRHPFLAPYWATGTGKDIFWHDALLARDILSVAQNRGITVLPIHDGFVTNERHGAQLKQIMLNQWECRFGTSIQITRE